MNENLVRELVESVNRLAATNPVNHVVSKRVQEVFALTKQIRTALEPVSERQVAPAHSEFVVDNPPVDAVVEQIDQMRASAVRPATNYGRMVAVLDGLRHAALLAQRPQNAAVRPRISAIVSKVAGVFKDIDTVQDLDKPLEQIEKAVHSLYGNQSSNSSYYFGRRGKGGHGAPDVG
jgi:hypothetical protein